MNDEIKEILDNLVVNETTGMCYLSIKLTNQIKDYITNLQQYYKDNINKYEELIEKYSNLQQENERLKNDVEDISCSHFSLFKSYDDYKSRCKKINEILKESPDFNYSNDYIILKRKIESVLQKGSDSQ